MQVIANASGGYNTNLQYQWYDSSTAPATQISGAINATYQPLLNTPVGVKNYYVIIDNGSGLSNCNISKSNLSGYDTVYAVPTIISQPIAAIYCKYATATNLKVGAFANKAGNKLFLSMVCKYNQCTNRCYKNTKCNG